jgi:hypothetical protein
MKPEVASEEKRTIQDKIRDLQTQILRFLEEKDEDAFAKKVRQVQRSYQLMERI